MGFDFKKYKKAGWEERTDEIPVPALKEFFHEGENPVWKIRNITAIQMERCRESVRRNGKALANLLAALTYATGTSQDEVTKEIGEKIDDMVPGSLVLRYELLMAGSVDPKIENKQDAIFFGEKHPEYLEKITDRIMELYGLGASPGKPKPCGGTQKSGRR